MTIPSQGKTKIASFEILPCIQPQADPKWANSKGSIAVLDGLIVSLIDQTGRRGEGHIEAMAFYSDSIEGSRAAIDEICMHLIGEDPSQIEHLLARMEKVMHAHLPVKAGIDCALHDLFAKQLGVPLNRLFGGCRHDHIPMQRIIPIKPTEEMAAEAATLAGQGYRSLKIKIDGDGDGAIANVRAIRERVASEIRLSVDANQAYTAKEFMPVLRGLEALNVDLVEQPVHHDNWVGLKQLRDATDLIIEADESARSVKDVISLIAMGACDSFNLKVFGLGGLRNTVLAARICDAAGLNYRIGTAFGPRLIAAQSAHIAASLPRIFYPLEFAEFEHLENDPYTGIEIKNGKLRVPTGIGSGVQRRDN